MTPTERVRLAFDVASKLGVARVFLDPCEVVRGRGGAPDRLSMMTYLHQLRTRLTSAPANQQSENMEAEQTDAAAAAANQQGDATECKDAPKKSKEKAKKKQRVNSGGGSASERYEQLLTKARTLLMDSSKVADKTDSLQTSPEGSASKGASSSSKFHLRLINHKVLVACLLRGLFVFGQARRMAVSNSRLQVT